MTQVYESPKSLQKTQAEVMKKMIEQEIEQREFKMEQLEKAIKLQKWLKPKLLKIR